MSIVLVRINIYKQTKKICNNLQIGVFVYEAAHVNCVTCLQKLTGLSPGGTHVFAPDTPRWARCGLAHMGPT